MREASKDVGHIAPLAPLHIDENSAVGLDMHRVLGHISFRPPAEVSLWDTHRLELDAFLRDGEVRQRDENRAYLARHPLVARSFATSVPVSRMLLLSLVGDHYVPSHRIELRRAATIYDVLSAIQKGCVCASRSTSHLCARF